jgi:hypothetical protein
MKIETELMKIELYPCRYSVWSKGKEYRLKIWWLVIHRWMVCFDFNRVELESGKVYFPKFISVYENDSFYD